MDWRDRAGDGEGEMPVEPDGCGRGTQNPRSQVLQPQALTYKGHQPQLSERQAQKDC